jgi:hypothetical protein
METYVDDLNVAKAEKGQVTIEGKVFRYKVTPRTRPLNWADLEITNDRGQSITIFFNTRRQSLLKEIKRNLKLYKWIK